MNCTTIYVGGGGGGRDGAVGEEQGVCKRGEAGFSGCTTQILLLLSIYS